MRSHQLLLPLGLLIIALGVPSSAQNAEETLVEVAEGAPLAVECVLRVEQRATWRRDGAPLDGTGPGALRPAPDASRGGRLAARLLAPVARAAHAGVYTCAEPPSHRVRVRVLPAAAAPPTPALGETALAAAAGAGAGAEAEPLVVYYDVGKPFALNCTLPLAAGDAYEWRKNGTPLGSLGAAAARLQVVDGGAALRPVGRSAEDDYGNYSCSAGGAEQAWELRGRPYVKLAPNTNVVEGQKLKISCKVVGKPYPRVWWLFSNESEATNGSDALLALGERARLETNDQGIENGALVLEAAQRGDAGVVWCAAAWELGAVNGSTTLRVKDMYAALWPFLGICAEVLLLCAVILVYEKRRTKPELDDSDTDNHDQKKS